MGFICNEHEDFMKLKLFLSLTILSLALLTSGQGLDEFDYLKSSGTIPDFFVKYLDEKINSDRDKLIKEGKISKTNARDFAAISNYKMQQLIRSGRVLYGDPLSNYANKILEKLKESSEDDLSDIKIYTLKSNEVNAFATQQRVIFITVGLWGQIQNEAQLAYIIAHECAHITEKHNQLQFQHTKDLIKKGRFGEESISEFYGYSKDHEESADAKGFRLAAKAGYDVKQMYKAFDVLLYAYLPIDEVPVKYHWLENERFKMHEKWIKKEVNHITAEEDIDDELSTHPNISNRKINIDPIVSEFKTKSDVAYLVKSKEEFINTQNLARFEMLNIYIRKAQYIDALYHYLILNEAFPNNDFLNRCYGMVWYGLAHHHKRKNEFKNDRVIEGEIDQLFYLVNRLSKRELLEIAVKQSWELSLKQPSDSFLVTLRNRTLELCLNNGGGKLDNFATSFTEDTSTISIDIKQQSKYDKISKKKKTNTASNTRFAWVSFIGNPEFTKAHADISKKIVNAKHHENQEEEMEDEEKDDKIEKQENEDEFTDESDREEEKKGNRTSSLDIKHLAMIMPYYYKNDLRKNSKKNISRSDMNQIQIIDMINSNATLLGMKMSYVNNFLAEGFDTEDYNRFSLLFDYLGEKSHSPGHNFYPFSAQYSHELISGFKTPYIGMLSIETEIEGREFQGGAFVLSLLTIYPFPFYLIWQFTTVKQTDYSFLVFDIEKHQISFMSKKYFTTKLAPTMQNAHIYNSLNQLTNPKK